MRAKKLIPKAIFLVIMLGALGAWRRSAMIQAVRVALYDAEKEGGRDDGYFTTRLRPIFEDGGGYLSLDSTSNESWVPRWALDAETRERWTAFKTAIENRKKLETAQAEIARTLEDTARWKPILEPLAALKVAAAREGLAKLAALPAHGKLLVWDMTGTGVGTAHPLWRALPPEQVATSPDDRPLVVAVVSSEWKTVGSYYKEALGEIGIGASSGDATVESIVVVVASTGPFTPLGVLTLEGSPPRTATSGSKTEAPLAAFVIPDKK